MMLCPKLFYLKSSQASNKLFLFYFSDKTILKYWYNNRYKKNKLENKALVWFGRLRIYNQIQIFNNKNSKKNTNNLVLALKETSIIILNTFCVSYDRKYLNNSNKYFQNISYNYNTNIYFLFIMEFPKIYYKFSVTEII